MVAIWTQTLLSAAEMSNILSAFSVVICLICTVIFIIRVQGMQFSSSSVVHFNTKPVQVDLQKIEIPFTCYLGSSVRHPLNEIHVNIKSAIPYNFQAFWSVNANNLKNLLYLPWSEFLRHVNCEELMEAYKSESYCDTEQENSEYNRTIKLIIDPNLPALGKPPRSHFPLVLLIRRNDCNQNIEDYRVGALLSIVHVTDADCPMATAILYHYLKQYSGQVTQLQSLYTQKVDEDYKYLLSRSVNEGVEDDGPCVICRVLQPTRALLPCRHVCVCALCFSGINTCPMCRCRISAFFLTDSSEDEKQLNKGSNAEINQSNLRRHRSFLNNMNGALNSFLGIRNN